MGHIAHLRKRFKSINTYDYIKNVDSKKKPIIFFLRIAWFLILTNFNPLHPKVLCASGSGKDFLNVVNAFYIFVTS